jgi:hypothetical protein
MSFSEESQNVVEISEMVGRKVTVYFSDYEPVDGLLHSLTSHGILIKNFVDKTYEIYPWWQVKCIVHDTGEKQAMEQVKEKGNVIEESKEWEPEITESPKTIVTDALPEDYDWEWEDDDVEMSVTDDEGDHCMSILLDDKEIRVLYSKDLELAKKIAKALDIKSIVKDYTE